MAAAKDLQHCVYLSAACAEAFVSGGGASSLVHYMRSCNRCLLSQISHLLIAFLKQNSHTGQLQLGKPSVGALHDFNPNSIFLRQL